jgi:hypothetical protein
MEVIHVITSLVGIEGKGENTRNVYFTFGGVITEVNNARI